MCRGLESYATSILVGAPRLALAGGKQRADWPRFWCARSHRDPLDYPVSSLFIAECRDRQHLERPFPATSRTARRRPRRIHIGPMAAVKSAGIPKHTSDFAVITTNAARVFI